MNTRTLMMVERIMYVDAETPLNCVFAAKIRGNLAATDIQHALDKIQQKHPLLRSSIDTTTAAKPTFVVQENMSPIPLRVIERQTEEDWLLESERAWYHSFKDQRLPLAELLWIKGQDCSELLWVLPHCICDGTSIVTLMRELLSLLDDPTAHLPPYSLFGSVDEFLPAGFNLTKKSRKAKFYLVMARLLFSLQRKSKRKNVGRNYALHWKLPPQTTANITSRCRALGITVHAALCAAFMQAFQNIQGKKAKNKVISPIDIRHFIPEIRQDHMFAFAPTVELSLKKGEYNLLNNTVYLKAMLLQKMEKINARELLWLGEQLHPLVHRMIAMLRTSRGGHDITLSNMGRIQIPANFKNFSVESVFSPTVAFPWLNANTLVTTTYRDQMDFSFMSHEDFLPKDEANRIKERAIALLTSL
ncbi:hypothetical protein K7A41_16100 [Sphingobacterium sp. InxBP1]|uniref:condensation domain-containing protein n=1 Tax=Sphingobacterium sp. InxBP1 TaxID=2870328 RepID=UPI002243DB53|nr:condensation domain-containing protein [Sphingobacterium sp. InxBP1]MCW8312753.1 hypothetical protein [Sphingobacterium sp. InxBP1]